MIAPNEPTPNDNSALISPESLRQTTEEAMSLPVGDLENVLEQHRISEGISQQLPAGAAFLAFLGEFAITRAPQESSTVLNTVGTLVGAFCTAAVVRHVGYKMLDRYWAKRNAPIEGRKEELESIPKVIFGEASQNPQ